MSKETQEMQNSNDSRGNALFGMLPGELKELVAELERAVALSNGRLNEPLCFGQRGAPPRLE